MGGLTTVACILAEAALTGGTQVNLREALAAGSVVAGGVWWMSRKFQQIDDNHKALAESIQRLESAMTAMKEGK